MIKYSISILVLTLFVFTFFIQSCTSDSISDIEPGDFNDCVLINVTYSGQIRTIINQNCAVSGCHVTGGRGNGVYETFEGVRAKVDNGSFEDRVFVRGDMPPDGRQLSDCALDQLRIWLDEGALNN